MLKRFNIYELDYTLVHFIAHADFQREPAHIRIWLAVIFDWLGRVTFGVDTQIACRWNLVVQLGHDVRPHLYYIV